MLIYGATKLYKWLLVPWMILHLILVILLMIYLAVRFEHMDGKDGAPIKSVTIVSILVLTYFYVVVVLFYKEVKEKEDIGKVK